MSKYEIRRTGGKPTLYVDGQITAPVLYALSDFPGAASNTAYAQKNIAAFAGAGVRLVAADTGLHIGWRKSTGFDPDALICELSSVLDANPDAKILLRLHMNPPYWWMRDNPAECVVYRTPDGDVPGIDNGESDRLIRDDHNGHLRVSFTSEKWLQEATECLLAFLDALRGTPEGDALMAVQVAFGINGECHQWGVDVSEPAQKRFRRFLREKYPTAEALRRAWNQPQITHDTAAYAPEPFRPGEDGCFRDPQRSRDVIDSQTCQQLAAPEAILHFCRAIKKHHPHLLCGAFYAYYLNSTGGGVGEFACRTADVPEGAVINNMPVGGHLFPELLYDDPSVDFFCGPFCYYRESRASDGATIQRALLESHRLRGMLWLTEMDQRPVGLEYHLGGDPEKFDQTRADLRRCTLQPLMAGEGFWYYDHRLVPSMVKLAGGNVSAPTASIYRKAGWWETGASLQEIAAIQRTAQAIAQRTYQGAADVLLVYDRKSYFYQAHSNEETVKLHHHLTRSGVVFDCIYASELPLCEMQRYKCVIFVNCHAVTPEEREQYRRLTQGRMVIHLHAQGYCDGDTLSEENLSRTVGMQLCKTEAASMTTCEGETIDMPAGLAPLFCVRDENAEVLARYDNGEAAAAICGNDVYMHLQYLPTELVKPLMQRAGVHIWCDSDEPVMAGAGLAAVNCQRAGVRTLTLPDGREIRVESSDFAMPVYSIETGERVM